MFTGIVTAMGTILAMKFVHAEMILSISVPHYLDDVLIGDSICVNGCCLTVTEKSDTHFEASLSAETLQCTTFSHLSVGSPVNLEKSATLQQALGGHWVTGHVDATATVIEKQSAGDSTIYLFSAPDDLSRYIAAKGSVTLDGVSLTVNRVEGKQFWVNVILHTKSHTTFKNLEEGGQMNMEVDVLARYVARFVETQTPVQEHA